MAHYTVKLSCLERSIYRRKQIGLKMSLKSRRGSQNLKFGGQTIPDAGGSNSKRPAVADLSPSPPNDQVAAAWWSQWWPWMIASRRCQQFGNVIRYLANKRLMYQKAKFVVNTPMRTWIGFVLRRSKKNYTGVLCIGQVASTEWINLSNRSTDSISVITEHCMATCRR